MIIKGWIEFRSGHCGGRKILRQSKMRLKCQTYSWLVSHVLKCRASLPPCFHEITSRISNDGNSKNVCVF